MENSSKNINYKFQSFKTTWKVLTADQRISLSMLMILLVAIPVGVLVSLGPTNLFSRAYLPVTPPISSPISPTETDVPTPTLTTTPTEYPILTITPTMSVVLNSSSGKSCTYLCAQRGLTCQSVGTDSNATNGKSWQLYKNSCAEILVACDGSMKKTANKSCSGNSQPWTNCKCN